MTRPFNATTSMILGFALIIAAVALIFTIGNANAQTLVQGGAYWEGVASKGGCYVSNDAEAIMRTFFHLFGFTDAGMSYCAQNFF
jgi:hypothetical protein